MKEFFKKTIILLLTLEAKAVLKRFKPKVIAVTGSVGKTSTKDATYTILKPLVNVIRNEKSFNGDIGVPLSILELPNAWSNSFKWIENSVRGGARLLQKKYAPYIILEVGADKPKDISSIAKWIKPHYAIFTRFPEVPVHVEFFDSKEQVIKEKKSLATYTRKNGILILNHDDPHVLAMKDEFPHNVRTYGEDIHATVRLVSFTVEKKHGVYTGVGTIAHKDQVHHFSIPRILAKTQILSTLPGIIIALEEGFDFEYACTGLSQIEPTHGRLSVIEGIGESTLIDDTYNSSPVAAMNALDVLASLPEAKRRIAVLGDMMELGSYAEEEHRKVGAYATRHTDILLTVGSRSKFIHDEAIKNHAKNARFFDTPEKAGEYIQEIVKEGDVVLFKASQSIRLERALKMCLKNESDAEIYLVRQDSEWQKR